MYNITSFYVKHAIQYKNIKCMNFELIWVWDSLQWYILRKTVVKITCSYSWVSGKTHAQLLNIAFLEYKYSPHVDFIV